MAYKIYHVRFINILVIIFTLVFAVTYLYQAITSYLGESGITVSTEKSVASTLIKAGIYLLGAVGLIVIIYGIYRLWRSLP